MARTISTFCCSVTCFDADGRLDEAALRTHFSRVADAGPGLYVGGSSPGEGYSLTAAEVDRLLRIAVEAAGGRVPVRAMGVEPRNADQMCEFLRLATKTGVDACQIYSLDVGHGWKPLPGELEAYFRRSLDSCPLPAILSSHSFMGYNVPIDMIERLAADYDNLIGVNLTTPDILHLSEAIARLTPRLEIHVGGPMHAITGMALGGNGFLSSEANMAPRLCQSVVAHFAAGPHEKAYEAYAGVMALMVAVTTYPGASVRRVKAAMRHLGLPGVGLRGPNAPIDEKDLPALARQLDAVASRHGRIQ